MATYIDDSETIPPLLTCSDSSSDENCRSRASSRNRTRVKSANSEIVSVSMIQQMKNLLESFEKSKNYRQKERARSRERANSRDSRNGSRNRKSKRARTRSKSGNSDTELEKVIIKERQQKVRVPKLIDTFKPGTGNDFKMLLTLEKEKFIPQQDKIVPWLRRVINVAKTRRLTKCDFNCFIFSRLDSSTKKLLGDIKLSEIEPQGFVDYLILLLSSEKNHDEQKCDFITKARPDASHDTIFDFFRYVYDLGQDCNIPKSDIWARFIHHLPPLTRRDIKKAIQKHRDASGIYPGADGILFLTDVLGKEELPDINMAWREHNISTGYIKKSKRLLQ